MTPPERAKGESTGLRVRRPGRFLRDLNVVALLVLIAAAAALFMSPRTDDVLLGIPDLSLGDRSPRTIRSHRALTIVDPARTKALQDRAEKKVLPVYDQEIRLVEQAEDRVNAAFQLLGRNEAAEGVSAELKESFEAELGLTLRKRDLDAALAGQPDELRDAVLSVISTVGGRPIIMRARELPAGVDRMTVVRHARDEGPAEEMQIDLSKVLTIDQARAQVDALAAERLGHLDRAQRRAVAVIAKALLDDNLIRNSRETRRRRRVARDSVKAVVIAIAPGEVVVRSGARVDEQKLRILDGMAAALKATSRVQVTAGSTLMVLLLVIFAYGLIWRQYPPDGPNARDVTFLGTSVLLSLLTLWGGYHGAAYLIEFTPALGVGALRMGIPVAVGVLVVRFVLGSTVAAVLAPVVAVIAGWMMDASLPLAVYTLAGGLAAASLPDAERLTQTLFSASSRIIIAQASVACIFDLRASQLDLLKVTEHLAAATVSGIAAVILAALTLPVTEAIFGYATRLRLGQLANLNHPLLKQLLVEAPGTYHHSIMVGTLAEAAAEAIGADPVLARVGGYYHDIGKLKNPRAFDENEARELGPAETAAQATELHAHVNDGIELAVHHRLGASVTEILRQHHGTSRVRRRSNDADSSADAVGYEGPKPDGREAALVMLADNVEAATRHLGQEVVVDRERIEKRVDDVVQVVLQDGQLDESPLTVRDLDLTRRSFVSVLEGRFSRRGRPLTTLSEVTGAPIVRAPPGEPN